MSLPTNPESLAFLEELYEAYLHDPTSVPEQWRRYFSRQIEGNGSVHSFRTRPSFRPRSVFEGGGNGHGPAAAADRETGVTSSKQHLVDNLVRNYRVRGHIIAKVDPLGQPRPTPPELDPAYMGLNEEDMDRQYSTLSLAGPDVQTLSQILDRLTTTYCRSIGAQFMHIDDLQVREWLQYRMESSQNHIRLERWQQRRILERLTEAIVFEEFLQKKYIGAKSFSLEGAETLIPLLDLAFDHAAGQGLEEVIMGMAHRGRLNVLANILGKSPAQIFREFEDRDPHLMIGGGDVKYHLGYSNENFVTTSGHKIHVGLAFNPSHLEFVNPLVLGRCRAKQDRLGDINHERGLSLLLHGDAAFAGEGIVQESLNLSQLDAYTTGGTLHVIVNNQIGFTTGPEQARSSVYCTDVAKMLQAPIFHVNGEDPEAVAQVVTLALDFRYRFKRDVFIDMYCYRRRGHNEGDEPAFTQPLMYQRISERPSVRRSYIEHLEAYGEITAEEADRIEEEKVEQLEQQLARARRADYEHEPIVLQANIWKDYFGGPDSSVEDVDTGVERTRLRELLLAMTNLPADFHPEKKIRRGMEHRREMAEGERPLDWAAAEALAFASLAVDGHRVRMTGQDSQRGTFSQRHSVLHDTEDGHTHSIFSRLAPDQAPVEIHNSPLSEAGVLGFEYGYSIGTPDGLVAWEAQFGDFVNAAQVIVDQFIASAEDKWCRFSGITLLLPHGFEGQGPEHSSARLERFLNLAAEDNIQVVLPTTPAQYFHALRRQVVRPWRKPCIILTPKSLLRHPRVVSDLDELTEGRYRRVIPDDQVAPDRTDRVVLCSGKIYYDLLDKREKEGQENIAIVRLEQLYPFPDRGLREALEGYADGTPVIWVQEEPRNMGAWPFLWDRFGGDVYDRLPFGVVARHESASPATGSKSAHKLEQQRLLELAFTGQTQAAPARK